MSFLEAKTRRHNSQLLSILMFEVTKILEISEILSQTVAT